MKRPAAARSSVGASVSKKCRTVAEAIEESPAMPSNVRNMLAGICTSALSELKDQRHEFQTKIVQMVGKAVNDIEAGMQAEIDAEQAKVNGAEAEKASRDNAQAAAQATLDQKAAAAGAAQEALHNAAAAKKNASGALKASELAQTAGDADLAATGEKKEKLEGLNATYATLKDGSGDKAQAAKLVSVLQKDFGFDRTMLNTLPPALSKGPDERGHFDGLVLVQFEAEASKRIGEFETTLKEGEPARAERAAAVASASAELAAATESHVGCQSAKAGADAEQKDAEKAEKDAAKAVKDFSKDFQCAQDNLATANGTMMAFKMGARSAFDELSTRDTPAPEPEEAAPVEEAAPAAEA